MKTSSLKMDLQSKKIKQQLISKRKDVKNKLDLLKHGEFVREKMFSPITKHLKSIENKLVKRNKEDEESFSNFLGDEEEEPTVFDESVVPHYDEFKDSKSTSLEHSTPERKKAVFDTSAEPHGLKLSIIHEVKSDDENEDTSKKELNKTVPSILQKTYGQEITDDSFQDYLSQYDPLPRSYIRAMLADENHDFDYKYGVRHNPKTEKFYIGNSQLHIDGSDIVIKNKRYKGTRGLYELLFKRHPTFFTVQDEKAYKDIVLNTNAHRRYYRPTTQIDGSKSFKYKKIISKFTSRSGDGMCMEVTDNPIDYVHWDDPNELVDRLRLLLASTQAGHSGHNNEITSIIEELREANIIE